MSEGSPWVTTVVVVATALLVSILVIAGLAYWGGQDWLLPRSLSRSPAASVQAFDDDDFGLTEYVDRTFVLDELGTLTIGGVSYDDVGLRNYLQRLTDAGGVHVTLQVDSDGTTDRRLTVEKICADVTGLPPNIVYVNDVTTAVALENVLDAP